MRTIEDIKNQILAEYQLKIESSQKDYEAGIRDCRCGIYDKWFRYNHKDEGAAYDAGWSFQNQTTQNEKVTFLPGE